MNCVSQTTNCRFACVKKNWKNRDGWERERGEVELTVIPRRCSSFPNECSTRQHRPEWDEQINEMFFEKNPRQAQPMTAKKKKLGGKCGTGGELTGVHARSYIRTFLLSPPPRADPTRRHGAADSPPICLPMNG
jgi:hypothetical protein